MKDRDYFSECVITATGVIQAMRDNDMSPPQALVMATVMQFLLLDYFERLRIMPSDEALELLQAALDACRDNRDMIKLVIPSEIN